jgi:hypothetical protein
MNKLIYNAKLKKYNIKAILHNVKKLINIIVINLIKEL